MKLSIWNELMIKNVKIQNRIVRSATNEHLGSIEGIITNAYIDTYRKLSESGVGLIITSHMAVYKKQRADLTHICINEKENFNKLCLLTNEIHKSDAKVICQISYGGFRAAKVVGNNALSPSGNENTCIMSKDNINECISHYISAIRLAKKAGFDGIQLHLAHGYLLSEFLDPFYNHRTDEYGGSVENRYRIIHQILSGVQDFVSDPNFLIVVKIDTTSKSNDFNFLNDQIEICKLLEHDKIDAIEISGQTFKNFKQDTPYFLENALKIKDAVSLPIILVGGFRNELQMNEALKEGIDFISVSRPFIVEENFISKLKNHQSSKCISCNRCFEIYKTQFKRCIFHREINSQLYENFHKK